MQLHRRTCPHHTNEPLAPKNQPAIPAPDQNGTPLNTLRPGGMGDSVRCSSALSPDAPPRHGLLRRLADRSQPFAFVRQDAFDV